MAKAPEADRARIAKLVQGFYAKIAHEVDAGFLPSTDYPDLEIAEQRGLSLERIRALQGQISTSRFDALIERQAAQLMGAGAMGRGTRGASTEADIQHGVARAEIEKLRLMLHRLDDRLVPYQPKDSLFIDSPTAPITPPLSSADAKGPSPKAVVEHHLRAGKDKPTPKTLASKSRMLGYLTEHIGEDVPISAVTPDMVRSFKIAIARLRSNHRACKAQDFAEKQTDNGKLRIASETVLNIYNPTRAFFAWATYTEGYLAVNPAENIRIQPTKRVKGQKSRRTFTADELRTSFHSPIFTGRLSAKRPFSPASLIIKDDHYWIPILAYYSGARLGELAQHHLRDVVLDHPVPHIEITEVSDTMSPSQSAKHVKSEAGVRKIPIHPDMLDLGFAAFVADRREMEGERSAISSDQDWGGRPGINGLFKVFRTASR